jgi:hypothetical protein
MVKNISIGVLVVLVVVGFGLYLNKPVNLGASSGTEHYNQENFYGGISQSGVGCGTATWNPGTLGTYLVATGTTSTAVSVGSAVLGNLCDASLSSATSSAVDVSCNVSAAGTATVHIYNDTASSVTVATGTVRVCVVQ